MCKRCERIDRVDNTVAKSELAHQFEQLARLLEVSRDNPFKVRSYRFASRAIKNQDADEFTSSTIQELSKIKGIGKAVVEKSLEYLEKGHMSKLEEIRESLPKAIGVLATESKLPAQLISMIWKDLDFTAPEQIIVFIEERRKELKISDNEFRRVRELLLSE